MEKLFDDGLVLFEEVILQSAETNVLRLNYTFKRCLIVSFLCWVQTAKNLQRKIPTNLWFNSMQEKAGT